MSGKLKTAAVYNTAAADFLRIAPKAVTGGIGVQQGAVSSSPDLRIISIGIVFSESLPMTGFRRSRPSALTVAVPFGNLTRFTILPWRCNRAAGTYTLFSFHC